MFLKLTPKTHQGKTRVKLLAHRNADQKETIAHIVSLQKASDKPLHLDKLSFESEESFHIMDLRSELFMSHDEMLAAVKGGSWKRTVETFLSRKKQFLEDRFNRQITLGELNLRTVVVGLTVQEFIPSLDTVYPWESGEWNTSGAYTVMTHSSTKIVTLRMSTNLPPSVASTGTHTGQIGTGSINH